MTQAKSRVSTPALSTSLNTIDLVDTSRRSFLSHAAALTAGGAALAAWALLEVLPNTREGLLTLIEHAVSYGEQWPDDWQVGLLENIAEALPELWQEGRV
jgi:hypothetical protein